MRRDHAAACCHEQYAHARGVSQRPKTSCHTRMIWSRTAVDGVESQEETPPCAAWNQLPVLLAWDGKTWAKFGHLFCCHLFNPLLTSRLMHMRACQYSVDTAGLPSDPFSCTHFLSCSYVRIVIITTLKCTSLNWLILLTITTENL
jgi:hypothetical protein